MEKIVIGIYYETPNGKIAKTYSCSNKSKTVGYYFDEDSGYGHVDFESFKHWKPRRDLNDFPNARDPRVPYIFDLYWDIKHLSELKKAARDHEDSEEIKQTIKEHYPSFYNK